MGVTRQYLRFNPTASFGLIGSTKGGLTTVPTKKNLVGSKNHFQFIEMFSVILSYLNVLMCPLRYTLAFSRTPIQEYSNEMPVTLINMNFI